MELRKGYKKTEVGVIPEEWNSVLLESVAKRGSGHTPNKKRPEYWDGDIKWISLKDSSALDTLYLDDTAAKITLEGIANSSAVLHPAETVVLSRDAGVGKSTIMKSPMAVSQHFIAWQCGFQLNNHFLYYWLQAKKPEFERIAIGSTIKTIGLSYFKSLQIPLPPLPEQHAIAAALSDVDSLLTALNSLIAKKLLVKQGAMQELLTGKKRLVESGEWKVKRLGDECELITKGTTPTSLGKDFTNSGVKFIKVESLSVDGKIIDDMVAFIDEETHKLLKRSQLKEDDLLISIAGALGRAGIVKKNLLPANTNQALAIVRLQPNANLNLLYVYQYLKLETIKKHIESTSVQGAQANLSLQNIADLPICAPSVPEQQAIAEILSDMDAEINALESRREKTRQLKAGMMQELLTGRIRLL